MASHNIGSEISSENTPNRQEHGAGMSHFEPPGISFDILLLVRVASKIILSQGTRFRRRRIKTSQLKSQILSNLAMSKNPPFR
jgi:hypothetical protein